MADRETNIARAFAALGGVLAGLWVAMPNAMHAMLIIMLGDILTGICRAGMAGELNSNCSFKGMMKKAAMVIVAALCVILDREIGPDLNLGSMVSLAFCAVEGFSIMENLRAMGIPLPPALEDLFTNMRKVAFREGQEERSE